jgi:glycyl-tRNA synthetase alpha subunit
VAERAARIARIRNLARAAAQVYLEPEGDVAEPAA